MIFLTLFPFGIVGLSRIHKNACKHSYEPLRLCNSVYALCFLSRIQHKPALYRLSNRLALEVRPR